MNTAARVEVDGVDVDARHGTLTWDDAIGERSVCEFATRKDGIDIAEDQQVLVVDADRTVLWGGLVAPVDEAALDGTATGRLDRQVTAVDWHTLVDREVVARGWTDVTTGQVVRDIIADHLAPQGIHGHPWPGHVHTVAGPDLLGYWRLADGPDDESWRNADGTDIGNPAYSGAGVELRRADPQGATVPWELVDDDASPTGKADPVADADARTRLAALVTALADPATETTLEALRADVADGLDVADAAVLAKVEQVRALLAGTLAVDTGLDQPLTNTELRGNPVPVSGVQTDALTNQQLRSNAVLVTHSGLTNQQLRSSAVPVSHSGLTNQQLRSAPVSVSGTQTDALTDAQLRDSPVPVADVHDTVEVLPDQPGVGGGSVLTFTFTEASTPWIYADIGDPVRVTDASQTPTSSFGIPVLSGSPFPIPVVTDTVRVWAVSGQAVTVYGTR